jgi:hypothetical protein
LTNTKPKSYSSNVTRNLVCVDSITDSDVFGRFYNLYLQKPIIFSGMMDLFDKLGRFFDTVSFPQSTFDYRYFSDEKRSPEQIILTPEQYWSEIVFDIETGKLGTFLIQVRYREHLDWQGIVMWMERKKSQHFASTLDLIRLIDSAVMQVNVDWETVASETLGAERSKHGTL